MQGVSCVLPDALLCSWPQCVVLWPFNQLQVSHGGQLKAQVLQCLCGAVDDAHVQHNVILVHCYIRFGIYRIRKSCKG